MLSAVSPIWGRQRNAARGDWRHSVECIPNYLCDLSAFYLPLLIMLAGLILRGVAFEYRHRAERTRWIWR